MAQRVTSEVLVHMLSILLLGLLTPISWSTDGLGPGCHLYPIHLTVRSDWSGTCRGARVVYACVGYCDSSAFPSRYSVLLASNFTHNITSVSRCCTIEKAIKVKVHVECPEGLHHDNIEILTAQACRCHMCHKARY
ncbi:glycoprotein hormone alpha-2 [Tachysurus ichikawai]